MRRCCGCATVLQFRLYVVPPMLDHVSWRESLLPCRRAWFPVVVRRSKRAVGAGEPQSKGCDETRPHRRVVSSLSKRGCAEVLRPRRPYSAFFTSAAVAASTSSAPRRRRLSASATPSCEASHTVSTPMASAAQTQEGGPLPCAPRMPARALEALVGTGTVHFFSALCVLVT